MRAAGAVGRLAGVGRARAFSPVLPFSGLGRVVWRGSAYLYPFGYNGRAIHVGLRETLPLSPLLFFWRLGFYFFVGFFWVCGLRGSAYLRSGLTKTFYYVRFEFSFWLVPDS